MITRTMKKFPFPAYFWSEWTTTVSEIYPERVLDFVKSYSENQIAAKSWLTEHLKLHTITQTTGREIWILGSWYGTVLVPMIRSVLTDPTIHLVDYDQDSLYIAKRIHPHIETHCLDVTFDLPPLETDIIINTSCEHMYPMSEIPMKGLCFYQSNNFKIDPAHINCVHSVDELANQSGIERPEKYTMPFHKYDNEHERYMVIGYR